MFIENPYYRLLTNHTIYAPLASSPVVSIIVAINSDGTLCLQNDTPVLIRPNNDNIVGEFQQDSDNFQLYHYMFPPLQTQDVGQYNIYSGMYQCQCLPTCICASSLIASFIENDVLLINIEIIITTEGKALQYIFMHTYTKCKHII